MSDRIGLSKFSLTLAAGETLDATSGFLFGFRITSLTVDADCRAILGDSEPVPVFIGISIARDQEKGTGFRRLRFWNRGAGPITVQGYYWVDAVVLDNRSIPDSANPLTALTRQDAPTAFQQSTQGVWINAAGPQDVTLISNGTNVNGVDIAAGSTLMTDPAVPGSYCMLRFTTYLGGSFEGMPWILPVKTRIPAGLAVTLRYGGSIKYNVAYTLL